MLLPRTIHLLIIIITSILQQYTENGVKRKPWPDRLAIRTSSTNGKLIEYNSQVNFRFNWPTHANFAMIGTNAPSIISRIYPYEYVTLSETALHSCFYTAEDQRVESFHTYDKKFPLQSDICWGVINHTNIWLGSVGFMTVSILPLFIGEWNVLITYSHSG